MGQKASSHRRGRRTTLFGRDFERLENDVREDSDYVTLVRVIPNPNDLTTNQNNQNLIIDETLLRPNSTLPERRLSSNPLPERRRPKTTIEPNIYCDLKDYLRQKSNSNIQIQIQNDEDFEEISYNYPNLPNRPLSFTNHCTSRCVCSECRLTRYHLLNWLLPNCTRTNAERLLRGRPDGTFLVRKSEKFPNQYTLSFVCGSVIRHCLVLSSVYGFGLKEPYKYPTLQQFVLHYAKHSLSEFNWKLNTTLKFPVFA